MRWLALAVVLFGCDGGEPVTAPPDSSSTADVMPETPPRDCSTLTTADLTGQATCTRIDCTLLDGNAACCLSQVADIGVGMMSAGHDTGAPGSALADAPTFTATATGTCRASFQELNVETTMRGGRCVFAFSCTLVL